MHKNLRKNRWLLTLVIALVLLLMSAIGVQAAPYIQENSETGYQIVMDDMANLLSSSEKMEVERAMEPISTYGNVGFISVRDHGFSSELDYADNYFHSQFGTESGTIFIIDMMLRKITVFSDGAIYKTVTKSYASTITDNIYTYATDGDYAQCALQAFDQINRLLNGQKIAQPMKYTSNLLIALIVALILNYLRARFNSGAKETPDSEWLDKLQIAFSYQNLRVRETGTTKKYDPPSSGGGGSGGGGGGGSSGGGGSHSF